MIGTSDIEDSYDPEHLRSIASLKGVHLTLEDLRYLTGIRQNQAMVLQNEESPNYPLVEKLMAEAMAFNKLITSPSIKAELLAEEKADEPALKGVRKIVKPKPAEDASSTVKKLVARSAKRLRD